MGTAKNLWFTYEPIPHTDMGVIYCEGTVQLTAKVVRMNYGKDFTIEFDGPRNAEVESALSQMKDWFYYTHIKDAEDNEF